MAWRLHTYDRLGSTQDLCIQLAQAGEGDGLAVRAVLQTAGRGTRGRSWQDAGGNLALSVLLRPTGPVTEAGQWALLAGLALLEGLEASGQVGPLQLKWPNDVLLEGRKVGGVLLDSAANGQGGWDWLVIGLGANLARPPDLPGAAALGPIDPGRIAASVLGRIDYWRAIRTRDGFGPMRTQWLARAHAVGTWLRVRTARQETAGQFAGLADDASLLLATGGRIHAVNTGEILQAEA